MAAMSAPKTNTTSATPIIPATVYQLNVQLVYQLNATISSLGDRPRESGRRHEQDTLRALLRAEREAKGITAQDLSLRLQMHQTYVSRMERGYRSIDVVELLDILDAMGVDPRGFMDRFLIAIRI